jgi:RAB protein geranylgeranyltransferase component A
MICRHASAPTAPIAPRERVAARRYLAPTQVVYDAEGEASGVQVKDVVAKAKLVVGDPSYFPKLCRKTGSVVRAIAILDHPIPGTQEAGSHQVSSARFWARHTTI